MKSAIISAAIGILLGFWSCKSGGQDTADEQVIRTLDAFYNEYVTGCLRSTDESDFRIIRKKYCTPRLLKYLDMSELDYDPFLDAQDCVEESLQTLKIKKAKNSDTYVVSYDYNNHRTDIYLKVVKADNEYKIDSIW